MLFKKLIRYNIESYRTIIESYRSIIENHRICIEINELKVLKIDKVH